MSDENDTANVRIKNHFNSELISFMGDEDNIQVI